jgi:hypothetical protein
VTSPNIPNITPVISIDRDDAINLLLSSIAMEELGLSHILNAEGEKIQYTLGLLQTPAPPVPPTIDQMLAMNESVLQTLNTVAKAGMHLQTKLESIIAMLKTGKTAAGTTNAPKGSNAPVWTAAHAFAASTKGQTVAIETSGTAVRFPDYQVLNGVMRNGESTEFIVSVSGRYLVSWMANIELASPDFIALTVNNVIFAPTMMTGGGNAGYAGTVIVALAEGSRLAVKIFGPSRVTSLSDGAGATLTIPRVK